MSKSKGKHYESLYEIDYSSCVNILSSSEGIIDSKEMSLLSHRNDRDTLPIADLGEYAIIGNKVEEICNN